MGTTCSFGIVDIRQVNSLVIIMNVVTMRSKPRVGDSGLCVHSKSVEICVCVCLFVCLFVCVYMHMW